MKKRIIFAAVIHIQQITCIALVTGQTSFQQNDDASTKKKEKVTTQLARYGSNPFGVGNSPGNRTGNPLGSGSRNSPFGGAGNPPGKGRKNPLNGGPGNQSGSGSKNSPFGRAGNQPGSGSKNSPFGGAGNPPSNESRNSPFDGAGNPPSRGNRNSPRSGAGSLPGNGVGSSLDTREGNPPSYDDKSPSGHTTESKPSKVESSPGRNKTRSKSSGAESPPDEHTTKSNLAGTSITGQTSFQQNDDASTKKKEKVTTQLDKSGNCPMRNTVTNCGSRCIGDGQCPFNQKCCPNKCGYTSCADTSPVNTGGDGGYKGSSNQAVYCNGVKCAAYEKCQYDRNTRREKCTRV